MSDERRIKEVAEQRTLDLQSQADEEPSRSVKAALNRLLGDHVVLESLPDIITVMDRDHRILYMNHTIPGEDVGVLIGTQGFSYIAPELIDRYRETFARV